MINALYAQYRDDDPAAWLDRLNGIFAFALWDRARGRYLIARDPMGVCPLYWGHDGDGRLWVASEMKALVGICADVAQFPPGHCSTARPAGFGAGTTPAVARLRRGAGRGRDARRSCARRSSAPCTGS